MLVRAGFSDMQAEDNDEHHVVAGRRVPTMNTDGGWGIAPSPI